MNSRRYHTYIVSSGPGVPGDRVRRVKEFLDAAWTVFRRLSAIPILAFYIVVSILIFLDFVIESAKEEP